MVRNIQSTGSGSEIKTTCGVCQTAVPRFWSRCYKCRSKLGMWRCECGSVNKENAIICQSCLKTQD